MSTVSVNYQFKSIKLNVTPGTPVSELLEKGAAHFKLDATRYGLFHNNKELSTALPFRLLNLPTGAKLALQLSKAKKDVDITIKIQFINSPFEKTSIVQSINNKKTLQDLIQQIESTAGLPISGSKNSLKFQSLSKRVDQADFAQTTLAQFGAENNASIRLVFENVTKVAAAEKPAEVSQPKSNVKPSSELKEPEAPQSDTNANKPVSTAAKKEESVVSAESDKSINLPKAEEPVPVSSSQAQDSDVEIKDAYPTQDSISHESSENTTKSSTPEPVQKHVYVYKAPEEPLPKHEPEEEEYDLTVSHARQYQNMLSQKAHESNKSKRLRQEANKKKITNIEIRVKFPDESSLQVNFTPNETNADFYQTVADTLVGGIDFTLHIPYPPELVENNSKKLTDKFESRNLVLFKSSKPSGPYLKQEYLQKAADLKEAQEIKLELERKNNKSEEVVADSSKIQNGVLPKKSSGISFGSSSSGDKKEKKDKKLPKWLKLGKK